VTALIHSAIATLGQFRIVSPSSQAGLLPVPGKNSVLPYFPCI